MQFFILGDKGHRIELDFDESEKLQIQVLYSKQKESKIPFHRHNYISLRNMAWKILIDHKIDSLPVNLVSIIEDNGWGYKKFSEISYLKSPLIQSYLKSVNGFTIMREDMQGFIIFYNPETPIRELKFTIAHELSHIYLQHKRGKNVRYEQEANMLACRLLMPLCVLNECELASSEELSELCKVPLNIAKTRYKRLLLMQQKDKFGKNQLEKKVLKNFTPFLVEYIKNKYLL